MNRWEWRTFGTADDIFGDRSPERVRESDELYILSVARGDTVKVRDDLMDVKHLEQVNDDGLEQWAPVMKAEFPLSADQVRSILEGMHVPVPQLDRREYELDDVVQGRPDLLAVAVHKHQDTPDLRKMIRSAMKDGTPPLAAPRRAT